MPEKVFEIRAPHAGEFPAINRSCATKKYRYVYSLANRGYNVGSEDSSLHVRIS
ncbi:hypothetical protein F4821DRAFT_230049 [Hypoxylon rubiginosum]|uniref:Uncharacterized protein n=1 Tax=Hypoxylon rubiginosum TaxID=110542 RepID=A0ACC0DBR4_9PEZI|nr:hypothetical protein F4821DRAFT_230049 [Hypoxylon rubiginosum]